MFAMRSKTQSAVIVGALCATLVLPVNVLAGDVCSRPAQPVPMTGASTPFTSFYGNTSFLFSYNRSWLHSLLMRRAALRSQVRGNQTRSVSGDIDGQQVTVRVRPMREANQDERTQWQRALDRVPDCLRNSVLAGGNGDIAPSGGSAPAPNSGDLGVEAVRGETAQTETDGEVQDLAYKAPDAENPNGMIIAGSEIFDGDGLPGEDRYARFLARSHCGTDYDMNPSARGRGNDSGLVNTTSNAIKSQAKLHWAITHEMIHAMTNQQGRTSINTIGKDGSEGAFGWYAWTESLDGKPVVSQYDRLKAQLDEKYGTQLNGDPTATNSTPVGERDLLNDSQWADVGMNERIDLLHADFSKRWDEIYAKVQAKDYAGLKEMGAQALAVRNKMCNLVNKRTNMVQSVFGQRGRWANDTQYATDQDEYFTIGLETALRLQKRHPRMWQRLMERKGWTKDEIAFYEGWWQHNFGAPLGSCGSGTQTASK